jgi:hypothetical protein
MGLSGSAQVFPVFGQLVHGSQDGEEWWSGDAALSGFDKPFSLIVRAKRDGPSKDQIEAFRKAASNLEEICRSATREMVELHRRGGICPDEADKDENKIWSFLVPEQIDVSDSRYAPDGRIVVLFIFVSTLHVSFVPAIQTSKGKFVQVLEGT